VEEHYKELLDKYPFISYVTYGGIDYLGVIQNTDAVVTTIYDYGMLKTLEQKQRYLDMADQWWWGSNRLIPINVFLKQDWAEFKVCIKVLNSKNVEIKYGPHVSLNDINAKKSKRKSITLIRKLQ
jgi:hypothetical protein